MSLRLKAGPRWLALASALTVSTLVSGTAPHEVTIYVAPKGDDRSSGLRAVRVGNDGPLASLEAARTRVRALRRRSPTTRIKVCLAPGEYFRAGAFVLDSEDSGSAGAPVVYASCGGRAALIGGVRLGAAQRVFQSPLVSRLDADARAHAIVFDLRSAGITNLGNLYSAGGGHTIQPLRPDLFFGGERMPLARWPNRGWARTTAVVPEPASKTFVFDDARVQRWKDATDAWAYGFWTWDWADSYARIERIDAAQREISVTPSHLAYGIKPNRRFRILNVLRELDAPGEWYLDRASGQLVFWPPDVRESKDVVFSIASEPLVRIIGASYVTFDGLTFEESRGAGVEIVGGAHNRLTHDTFRNLGTFAAAIGEDSEEHPNRLAQDPLWNRNGGIDNGIDGCLIHDTGEGGIVLGGGDRRTLAPAGNFVSNCRIFRYSESVATMRPAIELDGVGNRVSNNDIHDGPHIAILVYGNNHSIAANEIHHVCLETSDAGAIYGGRDVSQRGWIIRDNYLHDLGSDGVSARREVIGIYLDDGISGETITHNVFVDVSKCALIHGGGDNRVIDNLFVRCSPALTFAAEDYSQDGAILKSRLDAVHPTQLPYSNQYPQLARDSDLSKIYSDNYVSDNIAVGGEWLRSDQAAALQLSSNVTDSTLDAQSTSGVMRAVIGRSNGESVREFRIDSIGPRRDRAK